jgi:hypothetical protein
MISTLDIVAPRELKPNTEQICFEPNTQQFDVATLQLNDHGELVDTQSFDAILPHIESSRKKNKNGVIVILFAHGWHHGSDWNDSHFVSFRKLLASLCLREAERYDNSGPRGRRVIGIYLAWDGDPDDSWLAGIPYLTHLTFWDRYKAANRAGSGAALYEIICSLIRATKSPLKESINDTDEHVIGPLILTGHSMGAILVELAFLSVLKANKATMSDQRPKGRNDVVDLTCDNQAILAPDLVLALNSAADSEIAFAIKDLLEQQKWRKIAEGTTPIAAICYNPPVMLSLTSSKDYDTGRVWRFARLFHRTDGHNPDLFTHAFNRLHPSICNARGTIDFNQCWHCVRLPEPTVTESPNFFIDLPIGERREGEPLEHMRYELCSETPNKDQLAWIFQIPGELCADHNDIFNPQMGSLVLALIQISGAVMSLANEWTQTFES